MHTAGLAAERGGLGATGMSSTSVAPAVAVVVNVIVAVVVEYTAGGETASDRLMVLDVGSG